MDDWSISANTRAAASGQAPNPAKSVTLTQARFFMDDGTWPPKGLYEAAFAGRVAGFTGVTGPYEDPLQPDLRIDTTGKEPYASAALILALLAERHLITTA